MADQEVIETIYGKHSKYEIVRESGIFSTKFYIYRNGKYYRGSFDSLATAVEAARREAG